MGILCVYSRIMLDDVCPPLHYTDKPRCHFFNTFFYNSLYANAKEYNYAKVKGCVCTYTLFLQVTFCKMFCNVDT